jgi:hypothetical protein
MPPVKKLVGNDKPIKGEGEKLSTFCKIILG